MPMPCPLCAARSSLPLVEVSGRAYHRCTRCQLAFLDPSQRLDAEAEAAYYRLHRNEADDPGYRRFVAPLVDAVLERLAPASEGLDFGCGPGSAVAAMLEESGHRVRRYDPQFAPDPAALEQRHDFIVLCEVAEHLHAPLLEFERLKRLLRPGGLIAVMTGFLPAADGLARWHYLRDPTHVVLYSPAALAWLAERIGLDCELPARNVAVFRERH